MVDMRKRMIKVFILAAVFAVVLAACNQAAAPADGGAATTDAPAAAGAETPAAPAAGSDGHDPRAYQPVPAGDWRTPYPEPVHITAVSTQGVNWHFADGDDMHNNPWTRLYADELNVHVMFDWLAVDDYDTRLNMTIASDTLPDVFFIPIAMARTFHQLQAAGTLQDLTHAFDNYASDRLRNFRTIDPDTFEVYSIDGRLYGIPRLYYGQIDQPWHMWIRKDWYEEAGSPEIRTVADFEALAHHFMETQGAGYGLSVDNELFWLFRSASMFGAYIGDVHNNQYFWRPDATGRLRPGIAFPEFMTALEYWQRWFEEGIISRDFVTMDDNRAHEDVVNGIVGIQPWWQWWGWMNGPTIVGLQNNDAYFIPFNFPTVSGDTPARGQIFFPNRDVLVAHRDFENPGAWLKTLSLVDHMIFSPDANLTPEELGYYMHDGREHGMGPVFKIIDPHADMLQYQHVQHAMQTGDTSQLFTTGMQFKYSDSRAWLEHQTPGGLGAYLQMGFPGSAYARSQYLFDNGWIVQNSLWGMLPEEFDQAGSTGDIILEEVMQIIMGIQPVSHFETVLAQWYAQGGQIKEDAVNLHFSAR